MTRQAPPPAGVMHPVWVIAIQTICSPPAGLALVSMTRQRKPAVEPMTVMWTSSKR